VENRVLAGRPGETKTRRIPAVQASDGQNKWRVGPPSSARTALTVTLTGWTLAKACSDTDAPTLVAVTMSGGDLILVIRGPG